MEILDYNRKEELLLIRYNTKNIWEYKDITEEIYKILQKKKTEKDMKVILRKLLIVGENKGLKYEL